MFRSGSAWLRGEGDGEREPSTEAEAVREGFGSSEGSVPSNVVRTAAGAEIELERGIGEEVVSTTSAMIELDSPGLGKRNGMFAVCFVVTRASVSCGWYKVCQVSRVRAKNNCRTTSATDHI